MSPSRKFPAQAELWRFRAKLGHFNYWAETELIISTIFPHMRPSLDYPHSDNTCNHEDNMWRHFCSFWQCYNDIVASFFENPNPHFVTRLSGVRILSKFSFYIITSILLIFEITFLISEQKGKGHEPSWAENSSAWATARASLARAHH